MKGYLHNISTTRSWRDDKKIIIIVLNALTNEQGKNIHGDKKFTSFDNFWFLCKIEEDKLREKVLKVNICSKEMEVWKKIGPQKRKKSISKIQCYGCKTMDIIENIFLKEKYQKNRRSPHH